jgi:hypothetical protein
MLHVVQFTLGLLKSSCHSCVPFDSDLEFSILKARVSQILAHFAQPIHPEDNKNNPVSRSVSRITSVLVGQTRVQNPHRVHLSASGKAGNLTTFLDRKSGRVFSNSHPASKRPIGP